MPWLNEDLRPTRDAWKQLADIFNQAAETAKPDGMRVGYHNHGVEFQPLDGELPWDIFFSNTRPDVVMQLDIGNALHGGGNPVPLSSATPAAPLPST